MKIPFLLATSLRTRLVVAMGLMLVPIMGLATGSLLLIQGMNGTLNAVTKGIEESLYPVSNLQMLALKVMNSPHHYLIYGGREERHEFDCSKIDVNQAFVDVLAKSLPGEERDLVMAAWDEWHQVEIVSEAILNSFETGAIITREEMGNLHVHIGILVGFLDKLHELVHGEVEEQNQHAHNLLLRAIIMAAIIIAVGLMIASIAVISLVRSILVPLRLLEEGAENFGKGNLSYRVSLALKDELGNLALTFNAMAEKISQSQTKLEDLATHDGLTNLYNHREFQRRLKAEIDRSGRYQRSLALLMMDIDHFKNFNDTYGHQAGDEVLRSIGALLNNELRATDLAARYGGEEFAAILPEMSVPGALIAAERLRSKVADLIVTVNEHQKVRVTVSVGVAVFPEDARSEGELIAAADRALYAAKRDGRNRICRLSPTENHETK